MPETPVDLLDIAALRQHVSDNTVLFEKLLDLFLEQAPLWQQELDKAWASQNPEAIRRVCHKIKGAAATLHATAILTPLADLNRHAMSGDLSGAEPSLARLVAAITATERFVRAIRPCQSAC